MLVLAVLLLTILFLNPLVLLVPLSSLILALLLHMLMILLLNLKQMVRMRFPMSTALLPLLLSAILNSSSPLSLLPTIQHPQIPHVNPQLLHRPTAEGIASRDKHPEIVLQEPEGDLGEVGGFADAVDADKHHLVRVEGGGGGGGGGRGDAFALDVEEDVGGGFGGEDAGDGGGESGADFGFHA